MPLLSLSTLHYFDRSSHRRKMEGACQFEQLPADCISSILSLTSPRDCCRSCAVSPIFRSVADSDVVWACFLPSDCAEILLRAVDTLHYSTKKELYFRLCEPVLIDGGNKSFALDKESGAKCIMLSARDIDVKGGTDSRWWRWVSLPDSRFAEAAELRRICWLEIRGKISSQSLTPNAIYKVYLVYKIAHDSYGLDLESPVQNVWVSFGGHMTEHEVCLNPNAGVGIWMGIINPGYHRRGYNLPPELRAQCVRPDGWVEIEMGEFLNDDEEGEEVEMCFKEITGGHWKKGLIVLGIELRPTI